MMIMGEDSKRTYFAYWEPHGHWIDEINTTHLNIFHKTNKTTRTNWIHLRDDKELNLYPTPFQISIKSRRNMRDELRYKNSIRYILTHFYTVLKWKIGNNISEHRHRGVIFIPHVFSTDPVLINYRLSLINNNLWYPT